jgi:hypothetical protein
MSPGPGGPAQATQAGGAMSESSGASMARSLRAPA